MELRSCLIQVLLITALKGVVYLSLETVLNMFNSVLLVAEIAGARLAQVDGNC